MDGDGNHRSSYCPPITHTITKVPVTSPYKTSEEHFALAWEDVDVDEDSSSSASSASSGICDYYEKAKTQFMNEMSLKKLRKMTQMRNKKTRRFWPLSSRPDKEPNDDDEADSDSDYFESRKEALTEKILKETESIVECRQAKRIAGNVVVGLEHPESTFYMDHYCPHQVFLNDLLEAMLQYDIPYLQKMFPMFTKAYLQEMIEDFTKYVLKIAQQPHSTCLGTKSRYRLKSKIFKQSPETFLKENIHNIVRSSRNDPESDDVNDDDTDIGLEESSSELDEKDIWNPKPMLSKIFDHPGCSTMVRLFTGLKIRWRFNKKARDKEYSRMNLAISNRMAMHQHHRHHKQHPQQSDRTFAADGDEIGKTNTSSDTPAVSFLSRSDQWKMMVGSGSGSGYPARANL